MTPPDVHSQPSPPPEPVGNPARTPHHRRLTVAVAGVGLAYAMAAYLFIPMGWSHYARKHPSLEDIPSVTRTGDGHAGDPINVALIGSEREVKGLLLAAGYYPADPLTLRSCLEIADATVLKHPYAHAPVSNLYYFGRKQDLAFERPVGSNPRQRHHARFWRSPHPDADGRTLWIGQTSYDRSVGLSHTTGQITHHIAADVDAERNYLFQCLARSGRLQSREVIPGFHRVTSGINGGGDRWRTDGALSLGFARPEDASPDPER